MSGSAVTIVECRAPWHEDFGPAWTRLEVARLRYSAKSAAWSLYWCDTNERWHRYDRSSPTPDVVSLLDEIDKDPTGTFWG